MFQIRVERLAQDVGSSKTVQELVDEEKRLHELQRKQQELDEITARQIQEEEMKELGVKLKSPSEQQRKLLALFRPPSPVRLRSASKSLKSPEPTRRSKGIKKFFYKSPNHVANTSGESSSGKMN